MIELNGKSNNLVSRKKYFYSIDGLRTISCFGIIAMHIKANTNYSLSGFIWDEVIPSFTWLVYLFIMISGFGMCCGYLQKFNEGSVDLEKFYKRRYKKILPFFTFLLIIALIFEPTINNLYEASIELLLMHGLLPNNAMNVLGVCWTLGVIFLFYLLFPFFSVLLKTKRRAWIALIVSLWVNYTCDNYFFGKNFVTSLFTPRHSFIYCIPLFIAGGIIYLYREMIQKIYSKRNKCCLIVCIVTTILWYVIPSSTNKTLFFIKSLVLFMLWLSYAVGYDNAILSNKFMRFFSNISMEMYLSQMIIFRFVEKCNVLYLFGNKGIQGWISYITAFLFVILGLLVFIMCYKVFIKCLSRAKSMKFK